jgi:hypothetical protein
MSEVTAEQIQTAWREAMSMLRTVYGDDYETSLARPATIVGVDDSGRYPLTWYWGDDSPVTMIGVFDGHVGEERRLPDGELRQRYFTLREGEVVEIVDRAADAHLN